MDEFLCGSKKAWESEKQKEWQQSEEEEGGEVVKTVAVNGGLSEAAGYWC